MEKTKSLSKGEKTKLYILEIVAPVFNKKGYAGTSMADITRATGLTKGAIYGNFDSKEELALEAFNFNIKRIIQRLNQLVKEKDSSEDKLYAITEFYRNYYHYVCDYGGCPIVNISVDTHYQNPALFDRVKHVMKRLIDNMTQIVQEGIEKGEFKSTIDAEKYAKLIFAQIEGGIFLAVMNNEGQTLKMVVDQVDLMIKREIVK